MYFDGNRMGWDGTGTNCYGMGQKNMSHGQACMLVIELSEN